MNDLAIVYMTIFIGFAFSLMAFAVFIIGFLFGYKKEDKSIVKKMQQSYCEDANVSEREKKAKKEWKKFFEYDGSAPSQHN